MIPSPNHILILPLSKPRFSAAATLINPSIVAATHIAVDIINKTTNNPTTSPSTIAATGNKMHVIRPKHLTRHINILALASLTSILLGWVA
jgi:hypothetical protein